MEIYDAFKQLGTLRNSVVIVFTTCDKGVHYPIGHEHYPCFVRQLIEISKHYPNKKIPKISLILNTLGGNLPAARSIALLIKEFSEKFEVIIPHYAFSAGTLISLYADNIIMLEGSALGPIDPSVSDFKNTEIPETNAAQLYLDFIECPINTEIKAARFATINSHYDPILLGQTIRAQKQIYNFCQEALYYKAPSNSLEKIIYFLTTESSCHHHLISSFEAKNKMLLNINSVSENETYLINNILNYAQDQLHIIDQKAIDSIKYQECRILVEGNRFFIASHDAGADFLPYHLTFIYNPQFNKEKPLSENNQKFLKESYIEDKAIDFRLSLPIRTLK